MTPLEPRLRSFLRRSDWEWYLGYYRQTKIAAFATVFCALGKGLIATGFALAIREILEATMAGPGAHPLLRAVTLAVGLSLALAAASFGMRYSVVILAQTAVRSVRRHVVAKLLRLSPERVALLGRANLMSLTVHDTELVDRLTTNVIGVIIPSVIMAIALTGLLFYISPRFGLVSIAIGGLFWIFSRLLQSRIEANIRAYASAFTAFNRGILLTLERLNIIRAAAIRNLEFSERDRDVEALHDVSVLTDLGIGTATESLALLGNLATILLLLGAGMMLTVRNLSAADLMTTYLVLFLIRGQVAAIGGATPYVRTGFAALDRIHHFLELDNAEPYQGTRKIAFRGSVAVRDVSFGYGPEPLLREINLDLAPGSCVVVTGPNGGGKTTLINLLLGIYRPHTGGMFAQDVSYDEVDLQTVLEGVGYVPQEPLIFDGTIAENISYGRQHASWRDIERAASMVGAADFILALPDRYATRVGDTGALLSGGQRQRIALARAVLGNPSLLILDEPSNHLDTESVLNLLGALTATPDSPSVLIITHENRIIAIADMLFELRDGKLLRLPQGTGHIHLVTAADR